MGRIKLSRIRFGSSKKKKKKRTSAKQKRCNGCGRYM